MTQIPVIRAFREALSQAKEDGASMLPIDALEKYAEQMEKDASSSGSEVELELHKARLSAQLLRHQYQSEHGLEMLRSTVSTAHSALKASILINGGAAAALLAFIGSIWDKSGTPKSGLAAAMCIFIGGVFVSGLAHVFAYLSQAAFGGEFGSKRGNTIGECSRVAGLVAIFSSLGLFMWGSWYAYCVISAA